MESFVKRRSAAPAAPHAMAVAKRLLNRLVLALVLTLVTWGTMWAAPSGSSGTKHQADLIQRGGTFSYPYNLRLIPFREKCFFNIYKVALLQSVQGIDTHPRIA